MSSDLEKAQEMGWMFAREFWDHWKLYKHGWEEPTDQTDSLPTPVIVILQAFVELARTGTEAKKELDETTKRLDQALAALRAEERKVYEKMGEMEQMKIELLALRGPEPEPASSCLDCGSDEPNHFCETGNDSLGG